MRIDAHQHFWTYSESMEWITPDMHAIRRDFSPVELKGLLAQNGIEGCVAVQVDQTDAETENLLSLAETNDFIKGVVGWIDLRSASISEQLAIHKKHQKLKGFRHILQGQEPDFMLQADFLRGIKELGCMGYTYDILVYPHHLPAVLKLLEQCPDQPFVVDHMAKPDIKGGGSGNWAGDMKKMAAYPNVYCKLSGMVTEADWKNWKQADMIPYLDMVSEAFGTQRLMFGSDWPVCLVAAQYAEVVSVVQTCFSVTEQDAVMGENATRFYHLS
jgi:L-fuconolactonase